MFFLHIFHSNLFTCKIGLVIETWRSNFKFEGLPVIQPKTTLSISVADSDSAVLVGSGSGYLNEFGSGYELCLQYLEHLLSNYL